MPTMAAEKRKQQIQFDIYNCVNEWGTLDKLLLLHLQLYHEVFQERMRLERRCFVNRQLLKPWKLNRSKGDEGNMTDIKSSAASITVKTEKTVEVDDSEEISCINRLLTKAVKTRASLNQETEGKSDDPKRTIGRLETNLKEDKKSKDKNIRPKSNCTGHQSVSKCKSETRVSTTAREKRKPGSLPGNKTTSKVIPPYKIEPERLRKVKSVVATKVTTQIDRRVRPDAKQQYQNGDTVKALSQKEESFISSDDQMSKSCLSSDDQISSLNNLLETVSIDEADPNIGTRADDKGEEMFHILKHGSHLTVPSQLRKFCLRNYQLREKLRIQSITGKVEESSHKETFFNRVCQLSIPNQKVELAANIHSQTQLHERLSNELKKLGEQPLHDSLPLKEVLQRRKMLEFIFQTYEKAGLECSRFAKEIQMAKLDKAIHPNPVKLFSQAQPGISLETVFQPESVESQMEYHSVKQLLKYLHLCQVNTQLRIQETLVNQVLISLPGLNKQLSTSSSGMLYRAIYSILGYPGHQLPTLVKDCTDD